jgi:hypothetical protein
MYEGIYSNKRLVKELHRSACWRKFYPTERTAKLAFKVILVIGAVAGYFGLAAMFVEVLNYNVF